MPNLQEVAIVGRLAIQGATELAPALARKIAEDLPEIFGGNAEKALAVVAKAPADAVPLSHLAEGFQHNLQRFGLPRTANPNELFAAAEEQGLQSNILRAGGRGHTAIGKELDLSDGHVLQQSFVAGRSMSFRTTSFMNREGSSLTFKSGHFLRTPEQTWNLTSGSLEHQIKLPQH